MRFQDRTGRESLLPPLSLFCRALFGTVRLASLAPMPADDSLAQPMLMSRAPACNERNLSVRLEMLLIEWLVDATGRLRLSYT